jgi:hypothetical protein
VHTSSARAHLAVRQTDGKRAAAKMPIEGVGTPQSATEQVLLLQRQVGNAAVTRALAWRKPSARPLAPGAARAVGGGPRAGGYPPPVQRLLSPKEYDKKVPEHKDWLMRDQIRDEIKRYFKLVSSYKKGMPKTLAGADQYYKTSLASAKSIFDMIERMATAYRGGIVEELKNLPDGDSSKRKMQARSVGLRDLLNEVKDGGKAADRELRKVHHEAIMPLIVKEKGLRALTSKDRRGEEKSGAARGGVNTLGSATYNLDDGTTLSGFTKWDRPNVSEPGAQSGIGVEEAKASLRGVATFQVSELLKLGLIPRTALIQDGERTGQVMERAQGVAGQEKRVRPGGRSASDFEDAKPKLDPLLARLKQPGVAPEEKSKIKDQIAELTESMEGVEVKGDGKIYDLMTVTRDMDWWDPVLQHDMNALQFFDLLIGHADRHAGNYIIDVDQATRKVRGVKGIDNDDAWGKDLTPDRLGSANEKFSFQRFTKTPMPAIIDVTTARKFLASKWENIRQILAQTSMSPEEINTAKGRFDAVQDHIKGLVRTGKLASVTGKIDPYADWYPLALLAGVDPKSPPSTVPKWGDETKGLQSGKDSYTGAEHEHRTESRTAGLYDWDEA